jgi:hypothetical protein
MFKRANCGFCRVVLVTVLQRARSTARRSLSLISEEEENSQGDIVRV